MQPSAPAGGIVDLRRLGVLLEGSIRAQVRRRRRTRTRRWVGLAALGAAATLAARMGAVPGPDRSPARGASGAGSRTLAATTPSRSGSMAPVPDPPSPVSGASDVVADPTSIRVLVNKEHRLPPGWEPSDLVVPDVPFTFDGWHPKRQLRVQAATALEELFAAAEADGVALSGVSGFRSEDRQRDLFASYVARDGEAAAARYSARPGHSEHQTGLAIDVSGRDGACQAQPCFADTPAGRWVAQHAAEHGFVVRYPDGKEAATGYMYEPWHLRYVGIDDAQAMAASGDTLEEHLG